MRNPNINDPYSIVKYGLEVIAHPLSHEYKL
jgi:hypothetical protein